MTGYAPTRVRTLVIHGYLRPLLHGNWRDGRLNRALMRSMARGKMLTFRETTACRLAPWLTRQRDIVLAQRDDAIADLLELQERHFCYTMGQPPDRCER